MELSDVNPNFTSYSYFFLTWLEYASRTVEGWGIWVLVEEKGLPCTQKIIWF